ncbi:hypothetical protein WA171_004396 [Blastocystis sp. BT1]
MSYELRDKRSRRPSSRHPHVNVANYIPYVDDSVSPEEIMKKFEELEAMQKKKAAQAKINGDGDGSMENGDGELNEDELRELYTKIGSVLDSDDGNDEDFGDSDMDIEENDDDFDYDSEDYEGGNRKRAGHGSGGIHLHYSKTKHFLDMVTSKALSRKCYRVEHDETGAIKLTFVGDYPVPYPYEYIKIPQQIPLTWTHRITQYSPPEEDHTVYVDDPISFDYTSLGKVFNVIISFISNIKVVFLNTPPNYDFTCFSQLSLPRKLVPTGFVFVWADKENIPLIIEIFENKGFYYVENLVWVQSHDEDMKALHETTPTLLRRSKRTLLILRRGRRLANGSITYDPIDMRHQRHPDVIISPYSTYSESLLLRSVYETVETLVPRGSVGDSKNSDDYLQIFGEKGETRKFWIMVKQKES